LKPKPQKAVADGQRRQPEILGVIMDPTHFDAHDLDESLKQLLPQHPSSGQYLDPDQGRAIEIFDINKIGSFAHLQPPTAAAASTPRSRSMDYRLKYQIVEVDPEFVEMLRQQERIAGAAKESATRTLARAVAADGGRPASEVENFFITDVDHNRPMANEQQMEGSDVTTVQADAAPADLHSDERALGWDELQQVDEALKTNRQERLTGKGTMEYQSSSKVTPAPMSGGGRGVLVIGERELQRTDHQAKDPASSTKTFQLDKSRSASDVAFAGVPSSDVPANASALATSREVPRSQGQHQGLQLSQSLNSSLLEQRRIPAKGRLLKLRPIEAQATSARVPALTADEAVAQGGDYKETIPTMETIPTIQTSARRPTRSIQNTLEVKMVSLGSMKTARDRLQGANRQSAGSQAYLQRHVPGRKEMKTEVGTGPSEPQNGPYSQAAWRAGERRPSQDVAERRLQESASVQSLPRSQFTYLF